MTTATTLRHVEGAGREATAETDSAADRDGRALQLGGIEPFKLSVFSLFFFKPDLELKSEANARNPLSQISAELQSSPSPEVVRSG